jgi:hypothetical protein
MANKALIGLGLVGAAFGAYVLLSPKEASAAEEDAAAEDVLPNPPPKRPRGGIPRNGPNGTVLLKDLPADCRGYYDVAFGQGGASGCSDAMIYREELDRQYALYEAGDPFFKLDQYNQVLAAYELAYAQCEAAQGSEQEAIAAWVECLAANGLTPQQVWAG